MLPLLLFSFRKALSLDHSVPHSLLEQPELGLQPGLALLLRLDSRPEEALLGLLVRTAFFLSFEGRNPHTLLRQLVLQGVPLDLRLAPPLVGAGEFLCQLPQVSAAELLRRQLDLLLLLLLLLLSVVHLN